MAKCALMECNMPDNWPTLGQILESNSTIPSVRRQAKILIKECGFKLTDKICEECFYK